jgi:diguanylate cyclase (GGDEF)-like protein
MRNDSLAPMPVADTESLLLEVVSAGRAHRSWLTRWHRHVLCRLPEDHEFTALDGTTCRFARWCDEIRATCPPSSSLDRLATLHEGVHLAGGQLARVAASGATLDTASYDAFAERAEVFARAVLEFERQLRNRLSEKDPLTDVQNRRGMLHRLEDELDRIRTSDGSACIAMVDLDHFKTLNDTFGHPLGDRMLRGVAECIRDEIRPYDMLFRYGGDEFLLCLRDVTLDRARAILDRIRAHAKHLASGLGDLKVTLSIGVVELQATRTIEESIAQADGALYRAKRAGRDRVESGEGSSSAETEE